MKIRIAAVLMLSAVLSLAQTFTQTKPVPGDSQSTAQETRKAECPCCQKMAEDAKGCCHHDAGAKDMKEAMPCCQGKDQVSCMQGDKNKSNEMPCAGKGCASEDMKGCCQKSDKSTGTTAMTCCKAGQCGSSHDHGTMNK